MSGPGPTTRRFVEWTTRRALPIWVVALALAIPATYRTASLYLHLKSDFERLLPRKAPSVLSLEELRARMPGLQHLGVVVDSGRPENLAAAERFIDDLAAKVRAYPPDLVQHVRTSDHEERSFLEKNAALYVDLADLKEIRRRIEERRDYEVTKGMDLGLDDESAAPPALDFTDIQKKYENRLGEGKRGEGRSRFSSKELHVTLLLVEVGRSETGHANARRLFDRVRADAAALGGPEHYAPGMRMGYTGDVAISVEETSALMSDLSLSSLLVIFAVMTVLVLYYRWWRAVMVLVPPLLVATVYSFALASLPPFGITELNSNTAFLGSIIVGNGINFGIILLARYVEERRLGRDVTDALVTGLWGSRRGTLAAALAAGSSYAALSLTNFQGFRQFGIIGGIGMAFSWCSAQVLMPPLIHFLDRGRGAIVAQPARRGGRLTGAVARFVTRAPMPIVVASLLITITAAFHVNSFTSASIETDFSKLRRADTWKDGEGYWGRKMDALLGRYLTPMVVLTDKPEEARAIEKALRVAMTTAPLRDLLSSIRTADDVFPRDQQAKIEEAEAIRRVVTPRIRGKLSEEQRTALDRFLGNGPLEPFGIGDLPEAFTAGMRERDGHIDRAVLVFPKPSHALWEGPTIERLTSELRAIVEEDGGRPGRLAGSLPVSNDILAGIRHDGPLASLLAFVGAAAMVFAVFRFNSTSLLVVGSLVVGVLWLAAATMILGVRINFANFIAFPITFGIGVDYAVNVMARYRQEGERDVATAIRSTGGAVGLCSMTTIIGYSSLLVAQNRALFLFGLVAVLGEIACLTTAVVTLPAVLELWNRWRTEHPRRDVRHAARTTLP